MDADAEESPAAHPIEKLLEPAPPSGQRLRGEIRLRDSDHSDPGQESGQDDHQDEDDEANGSNGQAHQRHLLVTDLYFENICLTHGALSKYINGELDEIK